MSSQEKVFLDDCTRGEDVMLYTFEQEMQRPEEDETATFQPVLSL